MDVGENGPPLTPLETNPPAGRDGQIVRRGSVNHDIIDVPAAGTTIGVCEGLAKTPADMDGGLPVGHCGNIILNGNPCIVVGVHIARVFPNGGP